MTGTAANAAAHGALDDIVLMDASALTRAIHSRKVSCVEVMEAYLDHIERVNPQFNAIVALQEREDLIIQARERDVQLARGETMGPLHGFPHAVKDLEAVKGICMTMGSPLLKNFVPPADGLMVERLRGAGAIFIGKTNTSEFGLGSHTYNSVYGTTLNAYDPARSAGGSSGGAAVALALRLLPVADGSDYGGSLRNPAGWNGVFGFRTSIGRIPNDARDAWLPSMGVSGPMARNVTDLAMLLSIQAGFDARAPLSLDGDGTEFQRGLERSFEGVRIAWVADFKGHAPCETGVLQVCREALRVLESLGCTIEAAEPDFDFDALWQATLQLRGWQQGAALQAWFDDPAKRRLLKPEAQYEVEMGSRQSARDIAAASIVRTHWSRTVQKFLERYNFLVLPSAQVFPFGLDQHWPQEIAGQKMHTYHEWMKGNLFVTMSGCPALAAPAGFSDAGLPIGVQFVAPIRQEFSCLQLAHAYEGALSSAARRLPLLLRRA